MEVKRVKTDLGYIKYEVSGCSHVRISSPRSYGCSCRHDQKYIYFKEVGEENND